LELINIPDPENPISQDKSYSIGDATTYYKIIANCEGDVKSPSGAVPFSHVTGVRDYAAVPTTHQLISSAIALPNGAGQTEFVLKNSKRVHVKIDIFNIKPQYVKTIAADLDEGTRSIKL